METLLLVFKIAGLVLVVGFGVYYVSLFAGAGFAAGVLKSLRRNEDGEGKSKKSDV